MGLDLCIGMSIDSGSGPRFDPATLFSGAQAGFWYDPSDITTMRQGSTVGSTAAAVDAVVGYIADKSGSANHAIQATGANQPVLKSGSGKSWLLLDTTDFLQSANFAAAMLEAFSVALAVVIDTVGTVKGNHNIFFSDSTPYLVAQHFSTDKAFVNVGGNAQVGNALVAATPYVIVVTFNNASTIVRINGTQFTASPGTSGAGLIYAAIGASGGNAGASVVGKIYGMLGRDNPFSAAEIPNIETYLGGKAGIAL